MFLRIDRLQIELEKPAKPDTDGAAAVQEFLGGRFGEMSTLMNDMHQSVAFARRRGCARSTSRSRRFSRRRSGTPSWWRRPST